MTYPNGRVLFHDFGTADALHDRLGIAKRIRETNGTGTILAEYSNTGSAATVLVNYQQPDLKLDLFGGTTGTYAGLDRFARTMDHRWYDYTSGTVDRARYAYGYDHNSNRTWKEDPVAAAATVDLDDLFAYDGLDRLTAADRGNLNGTKDAITTLAFAQDFGLDQLNNWSTFQEDSDGNSTLEINQSHSHNDANELTQIDSASTYVSHDAAGNMTKLPQPGSWSSAYTLTWDAWNRLVKVADGASTVAEYEYDGLNRRIVKSVYASGVHDYDEHFYLSEQNQVLEVRKDASTNPLRQYTWGSRYIDDLVLRTRDTDSNGTLDETLYALQDANWNITALADTSGAVVERFKYNPYGETTVLDASFAADADGESDYAWDYRFTSREWDAETGLHYFRARYYHDGLGRFVGRDPLGYVDGGSLYAGYFVPNYLDPEGEWIGPAITVCKWILSRVWPFITKVCRIRPKGPKPAAPKPPGPKPGGPKPGAGKPDPSDVCPPGASQPPKPTIGGHGAPKPNVLQTGGRTMTDRTRKGLGLSKGDAKRAMEGLKKDIGQGSRDHGHKILDNGDVLDSNTGQCLGNLFDYL